MSVHETAEQELSANLLWATNATTRLPDNRRVYHIRYDDGSCLFVFKRLLPQGKPEFPPTVRQWIRKGRVSTTTIRLSEEAVAAIVSAYAREKERRNE